MKTIRNLNSSAVKGIALMMAALLISGSLFAQQKNRNLSNSILKSSDHILTSVMLLSENYTFTEEKIELEEWMTNLESWSQSVNSASAVEEENFDTEMVMEDWMHEINWIKNSDEENFDQELELENWMMSPFISE